MEAIKKKKRHFSQEGCQEGPDFHRAKAFASKNGSSSDRSTAVPIICAGQQI